MMDSIAAGSVSLSSAELMQNYAIAMAKKSMDTTEQIAQNLLEMLPQQPAPSPYTFDVYA